MAFGSSRKPRRRQSFGNASGNLLPVHIQAQAQCRPRSALGHRSEPGREANRPSEGRQQRQRGPEAGAEDYDSSDMTSSDDFEMDPLHSDNDLNDDEETGLTSAERAKRRTQKKKRSRLDERIAGTASGAYNITKQEDQAATQQVARNVIINALLIGSWYVHGRCITVRGRGLILGAGTSSQYRYQL